MSKRPIKAALLQVHSIVGLTISIILAFIGVTGAIMGFEDEIIAALNVDLLHVEARAAPMLSPDQLVARLQASGEASKVAAVTMTGDPAGSARVRFVRDDSGTRPSALYVDPYDGRVLGVPRAEDFFATVRRLHRWLLLPGDNKGWGRQLSGVMAIGLIVMLISGLVLRWPRHVRSIRAWLKLNWAMRGRGFQWSLHSVAGTWVMLIYLVMASTGLWWTFDWYRDGAVWLFSSRPPAGAPAAAAKGPRGQGAAAAASAPLSFDRAWQTFLREQDGRYATAQLMLPNGPGTVIMIRSMPLDASREGHRDQWRIDAVTGRVVSKDLYADKAFGDKILASVLDIHSGAILGWPGKLLFMLAAAMMPLFMVTGFLLYLSRRRLRPAKRGAAAAARLQPGE